MKFNFDTDDDTRKLLEITVHFLQTYFGYEESDAISTIEAYYKQAHHDDDYYHQLSSFHVAVRVHYFITLNGTYDNFVFWRRDNCLNTQPPEAAQHFRDYYFLQDD